MHIKRFEAPTMELALAQVKAELGPDALILSSRSFRKGRQTFGLMARSMVEVQAARPRSNRAAADGRSRGGPIPGEPSSVAQAIREPDEDSTTSSLISELRGALSVHRRREQFEEEFRSEVRGLRQALRGALGGACRDSLDPLAESLTRGGLDWSHAGSLVSEWRSRQAEEESGSLEELLATKIERRLAPPRADDGQRIRIFVGAPGVGKTTTLAKLAARNDEGEREVALLSLDHYRIGATDQLRRYAELLDSPFAEVGHANELRDQIGHLSGHAVLIDTAGRGQKAVTELSSLMPLREALGSEASIELVVDATVRREIQQAQLARFAPLAPDRIIFSKTDECESLADVANLILDPNCPPLCWLGNGQRVPEDLALVDARQLAREALGEAA